jgi:putative endonuclease
MRRDRDPRFQLGADAEAAVADLLYVEGFDLLARNLRLGALELDIVARRGALLVVTEVRTRSPGWLVGPFESVGRQKRARLFRAARRLWKQRREWTAGVERVRIDVAAVSFAGGRTQVEYVPGALG